MQHPIWSMKSDHPSRQGGGMHNFVTRISAALFEYVKDLTV